MTGKRPAPKATPKVSPEVLNAEWERQLQFIRHVADTDPGHGGGKVGAPSSQPAPSEPKPEEPKKPEEPLDIRIRQGTAALKESDLDARVGDRYGVALREEISIKVSGAQDQKPSASGAGAPSGAGGATQPGMPPPPPPTQTVTFSTLDRAMPSRDKSVDWYVDIDFSPIVQKDIKPYIDSLKVLGEMLPGENPESRRFLVTQALTALGVNDVDKMLDALFPPLPPGTPPSKPLIAPQQPGGQPGQPGQPPQVGPGQAPPQLGPGPQAQQLAEVREAERAALLLELAGWRD